MGHHKRTLHCSSSAIMAQEVYLQQLRRLYHQQQHQGQQQHEQQQQQHQQQQQPPQPQPQPPLILDARPHHKYLEQRLSGAVNIPLAHLASRCYLLPDKATPFAVVTTTTTTPDEGVESVQSFLSSRGWTRVSCYLHDEPELWAAAAQLSVLEQGKPADPCQLARRCLFAPSGLLVASIDRIEAELVAHVQQHQHQQEAHVVLRALDVGCGSGRDVAWLASRKPIQAAAQPPSAVTTNKQHQQQHQKEQHHKQQPDTQQQLLLQKSLEDCQLQPLNATMTPCSTGSSVHCRWHATGVDEWVGALERAADLAQAMQLNQQHVSLACVKICCETGQLQELQVPQKSRLRQSCFTACSLQQQSQAVAWASSGRYDLIICCRFLVRALLPNLSRMLNPGGFILYCTFLELDGTKAFGRPSGSKHLLQPGELAAQHFGPEQGFAVLRDDVVCTNDGREVSWFMARKL